MKKMFLAVLLLACCTIYAQQQTFSPLKNLTGGTWQMKTKKGFICERWVAKGTTELSGTGFSIVGKDTTIQERVKLVSTSAGVFYIPTVTNQNNGNEVRFKLTSSTNSEYVFVNAGHDFPQRVGYKFISRDSLHAWIDGTVNGKFVKQDFNYRRVK